MTISRDALAQMAHHGVDMLIERIEFAEANAAEFSRRYNSEVKSVNSREKILQRIRSMHTPYETEDGDAFRQRCKHCIGAYDPKSERLINTPWPCPTIDVFRGEPQ